MGPRELHLIHQLKLKFLCEKKYICPQNYLIYYIQRRNQPYKQSITRLLHRLILHNEGP